MDATTLTILILICWVVTYSLRFSFIALLGFIEMPKLLEQALKYVPAAVFPALVLPRLVYPEQMFDISLGNERLIAGIIGILVALWTKNVIATIGVGMLVLWLLQWLM